MTLPGVDDPTCHDCLIARALREERDNLRHEVAVLKGLTRLPGAVRAAHGDTTMTRQAPPDAPAVCPRCGYDYTNEGGATAAAFCDCDE